MSDNDNLKNLNEKLAQFRQDETAAQDKEDKSLSQAENMNIGMRAGFELVVTIGIGTAMGVGLDNWLNTKPLFLIVFLLLGVCAGFMNIYRLIQGGDSAVGFSGLQKVEKDAKKSANSHEDNDN